MSAWTIKCSSGTVTTATAFETIGLGGLRRERISGAADVVTFDAPGNVLGTELFADRSTITIYKDGTVWFVGVIRNPGRGGSPSAERITYTAYGPWFWLKAVYMQDWYIYDGGTLQNVGKTRVILGQDGSGSRWNIGEQIKDALQCTIDAYVTMAGPGTAPFQIGDIDPDMEVPWEECTDITCEEVILKMLRYVPDMCCWFDYSTTPPTFHCKAGTTQTQAVDGSGTIGSVNLRPRYDLQVPGVRIIYEQRGFVSGLPGGDGTYEQITTDSAGTVSDIEAVILTIALAGRHDYYVAQKIETTDWPTSGTPPVEDLNDKAWWKQMLPELSAIADGDMTITNGARTSALDRILSQGTIQEWMTDGSGNAIQSEACTVTARLTYTRRNAAGVAVGEKKERDITVRVTATDAETKWYYKLDYVDLAEPIPVDFAQDLYDAWNLLHYEGDIMFVDEECALGYHPGDRLNLTGGMSEWTTMAARIQRIVEDVDMGLTTLTLGPPLTHRPDIRELLRKIRMRNIPKGHRVRITGNPGDGPNAVNLGGDMPQYYGGVLDGENTEDDITYYDPATGNKAAQIQLRPDDSNWEEHRIMIAQDNAGVIEVKPGWLRAHT